jgi:flagellar motor switch protein FliN/FliY
MSTDSSASQSPGNELILAFAKCMTQVLGEIAGTPIPCEPLQEGQGGLLPAGDEDLWLLGVFSGSVRGEISLHVPVSSAVILAQRFMSEALNSATKATPEHREATLELLRQIGGLVATSVASSWGEVQLHLEAAPARPSWSASSTSWLRSGQNDADLAWVEIQLSAALIAALRTEKTQPAPAEVAATVIPPAPDAAEKLGVLMDVDLAVTLRFGARRLLLREILELDPGAVIELDRQVNEPVDMLLDGRVIARGEIVVLDGNYGLRVTEIAP